MNILVTGGAGFIGSHVCDALMQKGHALWCVDNLHLGREENIAHLKPQARFTFKKIDVLDRGALDALFSSVKFDAVFHLAANSDIQQGSRDHEIDLRLTFLTTYEVLEAMLRHNVRHILFASSSAVFGKTEEPLHETYGPLAPVSFYGASKLAAEAYISVFVENYGFKAEVIRFPNVVGERFTHGAIYDFMARLKKDPTQLTVLGNGTQSKPFMYVKDLVRGMLLVFEKAKEPFAVYHLGCDSLTTVREIAEMVIEEMGLKNVSIKYTGGNVGWVGDVPRFQYDTTKARALGFTLGRTSTEAVRLAIRAILGKQES